MSRTQTRRHATAILVLSAWYIAYAAVQSSVQCTRLRVVSVCTDMADTQRTYEEVKEYYGKTIKTSDDLKTTICVSSDAMPHGAKLAMKLLHPEILTKTYGCGAVYPECVEGCHILDLGSGAGFDCFILSKLVGANGHVTGVDMTEEQLETANSHISYHMQQFGYSTPNVDFRLGYMEKLGDAGLKDNSFDIVISNCVINLSPDKAAVLREAYRVLKPGGEMYFSDIYSDSAVPESVRNNPVLWGECLVGALWWKDMMTIATSVGFAVPILVKSTVIKCTDCDMQKPLASIGIRFCSAMYRFFKPAIVPTLVISPDEMVEVKYNGTIEGHEKEFTFSYHGPIAVDQPVLLPTSVVSLIQGSRFGQHFTFKSPSGGDVAALCQGIGDFLEADPFALAGNSRDQTEGSARCGGSAAKPCCS